MSEGIAGAYCTRMLATSGADVLVGERPGGSALRYSPPLLENSDGGGRTRSAAWEYFHSYKRGTTVRSDDEILKLAAHHDVVVLSQDGFGTGADAIDLLDGLAHRIRAEAPAAIVVAISSFGLTGPYRHWRLNPLGDWAIGGHLLLTGEEDREPIPGGGPWVSCLVGATAAIGVQAAAMDSLRTGEGALIDIGAMESVASCHQWSLTAYTHTGLVKHRWGNNLGELHHPISMYECLDGWIVMACAGRHQWEGLCIAMDRVELLADEHLYIPAVRFDRAAELDIAIEAWCKTQTTAEAVGALQTNQAPAARVNDMFTMLSDDQLEYRSYWVPDAELAKSQLGDCARMPGQPFVIGDRLPFRPAPALGADADGGDRDLQAPKPNAGHLADMRPIGTGPPEPGVFAPLAGVRIIEFSIAWAGPLAGRFLADLGAEVIKVEHPTARGLSVSDPGDASEVLADWERGDLPPASVRNGTYPDCDPGDAWWNRIGYWNKMNRGKQSLCLDVKGPGGRELFDRLVASSDVLLNNYSPRGVRSLGIDEETLRAVNPDIICVDMSGFGATGPGSQQVSFGPVLDATSGLADATGYADSGPYKQGIAFPDAVGGLHGAIAVLTAIWERQRTGAPIRVDLSQLETLLAIAGDLLLESSVKQKPPERRGARSPVATPAGVFRSAGEDDWVALTIADDTEWKQLCRLVGASLDRAEWATFAGRHVDEDEIDEVLTVWTSARTKMEATVALQDAGIAASPLLTNKEVVEDPHLADRGFMVTLDNGDTGPCLHPGTPLRFDTGDLQLGPAPKLGDANADLLAEFGYAAADIATLIEAGTLATKPPA